MTASPSRCTPAKLLAGLQLKPPKALEFDAWDPDCRPVHPIHPSLRVALRGKSALFLGDCWERRTVEHLCRDHRTPKEAYRWWWAGQNETRSVLCTLPDLNVTLAHVPIFGLGRPPYHVPLRGYQGQEELSAVPTEDRVVQMIRRFRSVAPEPHLISVQSTVYSFSKWADTFVEPAQKAEPANHTERRGPPARRPTRRPNIKDLVTTWWGQVQQRYLDEWLEGARTVSEALALEVCAEPKREELPHTPQTSRPIHHTTRDRRAHVCVPGCCLRRDRPVPHVTQAPQSHVYWNTRYTPTVEFLHGTVGKAKNNTVPNLPWAYFAMSEAVRWHHSQWRGSIGLLDMARYSEAGVGWYSDGVHQQSWMCVSFGKLILKLMAVLPPKSTPESFAPERLPAWLPANPNIPNSSGDELVGEEKEQGETQSAR
jgi:hypothetical protein